MIQVNQSYDNNRIDIVYKSWTSGCFKEVIQFKIYF